MSLYATALDLELFGAPAAALQRVRTSEAYQLTMASGMADDYLRGRYVLPLVAVPGETLPFPATGSTGTGTVVAAYTAGASYPLQAYGIIVQVLTTGALGVATARMSVNGGVTYSPSFVITATPIVLSFGITLTFSDTSGGGFYVGDQYKISVSYGSLTGYVVSLATFTLLRVRGVAPDGNAYDPIRDAYKQALRWLEHVRDLRTDPGLTASTGGDGSDVFIEVPTENDPDGLELDRSWQSVMGRGPITSPSGIVWVGGWTA